MKKIKLGKSSNIKTLSKKDFELYSYKAPFIVENCFKHIVRSLKKGKFDVDLFVKFISDFYLAGDFLSAIKLARMVNNEKGGQLTEKERSIVLSSLTFLYSLARDFDLSSFYLEQTTSLKEIDREVAYRWLAVARIILDYSKGNYLSAYLNGKRFIDNVLTFDTSHKVFSFQPKHHLIGILIRVTNRSAMLLAESEKHGSEKRKMYFDSIKDLLEKVKSVNSKAIDFFYFCELSVLYSKTHSFPNAQKALASAYNIIMGRKRAFHRYSYVYYQAKAFFYSQKGEFSEAYKQIKLAYRASFNVSDVYDELDVIDQFLTIAREFSRSDPILRKQTSEFYMKGNSLLKQLRNFLEEKDWYTGKNHSAKVAALSYLVANKLVTLFPYMKSYIDVQSIYLAGYVHDIGKVKIPWLLINKINKLEEYEIDYLINHVLFGKEILEELNFKSIARVIYQHHESPDGKGYPEGIRNVSVEANIISLADSFEAMTTSNRKYKKPKSLDTAKREIISLSGTKFYPEVIEAFKSVKTQELKSFLDSLK